MAQQTVNVGTIADDGTGDVPRTAGQKINANFTELYAADSSLTSALAGKAATSHTHAVADLSDASADAKLLLQAANDSAIRTELGLGTASTLNVGTSANNVVQLNGSAQLPAVDGSLLDLRQPVGDFMAFSMLVLKEGIAPTGNSGLTAPQQATYQYGWGALSSSVTCSAGGNPAYQDNTLVFGWNTNDEVYNESSIHISFESEFANSGLEADKAMEIHFDGNTRDGNYFRLMTLIGPKNDETNLDKTTGVLFAAQRMEVRDYAYGQGSITPGFKFDFRDSEARFIADADTTIDTLQTNGPGFRQLIDEPLQTYVNLPWVDTSLVCHIEQDTAVTGRMVATGRISGNEIRLNDYTYNRVASGDSGGGFIGGYNVVNAPGPELAENGTGSGIGYSSSGVRIYASSSGTAGDSITEKVLISPTLITCSLPISIQALIVGYTEKTANYTATTTDHTINCTSNTFAVTLPTAVGATGQIYVIKNSGSGVITINTTSAQTIDGQASGAITLNQYDSYTVQSNGSDWIIL